MISQIKRKKKQRRVTDNNVLKDKRRKSKLVRTGGLIRRRGIAQWMETEMEMEMAPPTNISLSLSLSLMRQTRWQKEMNSKYSQPKILRGKPMKKSEREEHCLFYFLFDFLISSERKCIFLDFKEGRGNCCGQRKRKKWFFLFVCLSHSHRFFPSFTFQIISAEIDFEKTFFKCFLNHQTVTSSSFISFVLTIHNWKAEILTSVSC